jgi:hypothetical protein
MEGPPRTGLLTQVDDLESQAAQRHESQETEVSKFAKTLPQDPQAIGIRIARGVGTSSDTKGNGDQGSVPRRPTLRIQAAEGVHVHAHAS